MTVNNSTCSEPRTPNGHTPEQIYREQVAQAAFIIAEKLDLGRRRPPPSVTKVFRLYFHDLLSASKVARLCRCSKTAVIRRLNLIRKLTGLPLERLKIHYPTPGFIDGLRSDTPTARMNRGNLLYAGIDSQGYFD